MRVASVFLGLVMLAGPAAVMAQADAPVVVTKADVQRTDRRLNKLEGELRAVQRKVFPGGAIEPEIVAPVAAADATQGTPASNPLADLGARVGEMERQLRTLTGQVETNEFKVRQMESALQRLRGDVEFRLGKLEGGGAAEPVAGVGANVEAAMTAPAANVPSSRPGTAIPPVGTARIPATAPVQPAGTVAVPKAATAVLAWQAAYAQALNKNWPATEAHMTAYLVDWPTSVRIAQAQFWLGKSYAERQLHAQSAEAYLKVYNDHPSSDRAPDALLGLSGALIGIKNPQQACRVLGELDSVYGAKLTTTQRADAKALRGTARCA